MTAQNEVLDLARIEQFDPKGGRGTGNNRRFCCPLCGDGKPKDAAHRSLSLDLRGLWNCKRCGASGKLRDFWENRENRERENRPKGVNWRRAHVAQKRAELSKLRDETPNEDEIDNDWRARLSGLLPLADTVGESYLSGRGIGLEVAQLARVRFCPDWMKTEKWRGCASVVFSIRDDAGKLVAAQGRECAGKAHLTIGHKTRGVFAAPAQVAGTVFTPFDAKSPGVILTEAPIDALSLAACGFPALALCGINAEKTTGPAWLQLKCGLKSVYLAFDADEAGDEAAAAMAAKLEIYGAKCERLRPENSKDWNKELSECGRDALGDWLASRVQIVT